MFYSVMTHIYDRFEFLKFICLLYGHDFFIDVNIVPFVCMYVRTGVFVIVCLCTGCACAY